MKKTLALLSIAILLASCAMLRKSESQQEGVNRVIGDHMPALQGCYQKELLKNPRHLGEGSVLVQFEVNDNGNVRSTATKESSLKNQTVESCLNYIILGLQFPPAPMGKTYVTTYSFVFKKSADR